MNNLCSNPLPTAPENAFEAFSGGRCPLTSWTHKKRAARRDFKRETLLRFLASGQLIANAATVADLLDCDARRATALCKRLVAMRLLKEQRTIDLETGGKKLYYSITPEGCARSGIDDEHRYASRALPKAAYTVHFDMKARAQIAAERAGWQWTTEREIRQRRDGMRKIPDGIMRGPRIIAVEIEREAKSVASYRSSLQAHLADIENGYYDRVLYIHPNRGARGIFNSFCRVDWLKIDKREVEFSADIHLRDFDFVNWSDWQIPTFCPADDLDF